MTLSWDRFGRPIAFAIVLSLSGGLFVRAQKQDQLPVVTSENYTVAHLPFLWPTNLLQAKKITKRQVLALVNGNAQASAIERGENPGNIRNDVESYTFANFDNGPLYLVATSDWGSTWLQYFEVIRCEKHRCHQITIHSDPSIDLDKQLLDLDKDGRHQILVEVCVCVRSARQGAYLPYIYEIAGNKAIDSSRKYAEFYRPWLSPIQPGIPSNVNSQEMVDEDYAESLFERDDVERRVFGERTAGLSNALNWEKSKYISIVELALETFERIDNSEADAGLKRLALSESTYIRKWAQEALARKTLKSVH